MVFTLFWKNTLYKLLVLSTIHNKRLPVQASNGTNIEIVACDVKWIQNWNSSSAESTLEPLTDSCDETCDYRDDVSLRKAAGNFEN